MHLLFRRRQLVSRHGGEGFLHLNYVSRKSEESFSGFLGLNLKLGLVKLLWKMPLEQQVILYFPWNCLLFLFTLKVW